MRRLDAPRGVGRFPSSPRDGNSRTRGRVRDSEAVRPCHQARLVEAGAEVPTMDPSSPIERQRRRAPASCHAVLVWMAGVLALGLGAPPAFAAGSGTAKALTYLRTMMDRYTAFDVYS